MTLAANGTTTLDTAVTIDRLTLNGAGARLDITTAGSLTSMIDVTQTIGTVQVNGTLRSAGDYFLRVGGINGTGTIIAPFFTSLLGTISPGTSGNVGSVGTLNFNGNIILASGNTYLLDLGANGISDRIAVGATTFTGTTPTNGIANVGGVLVLNFSASTLRAGNVYTILTAQGGVTGLFQTPTAISAILTPQLTYQSNQVQLAITAGSFRTVVGSSAVQRSYGQLLDQNRANAAALDAIYGLLDLQSAAAVRATIDGLAPRSETLLYAIGTAAADSTARFHRDRLAQFDANAAHGGTLSVIGRPIELAAAGAASLAGGQPAASDTPTRVVPAKLPDDVGAYLAGGYIRGNSASALGLTTPGARDRFTGFHIVGGLEKYFPGAVVGASFGYTELNGTVTSAPQSASGGLYQGTLYARADLGHGWSIDGQASAGLFDSNTVRNVAIAANNFRLTANDSALSVSGEVGAQKTWSFGVLRVAPRVSVRSYVLDFGGAVETGGGPALQLTRFDLNSVQGRAGVNFTTSTKSAFKPFVGAHYVHEFSIRRSNIVAANFVGGIGASAPFLLAGLDRNWAEVSGGISYAKGNWELSVAADTTVWRSDVQNQSYRGAIAYHF